MSFNDDPFALSSGLIEDFEGRIEDAYFTFDANYNSGNTLVLKLDVEALDPDARAAFEGGRTVLMYPCGRDWEPAENGKRATHPKSAKFNKNSGVGMLVAAAMGSGAEQVLRERAGDAGPTDANIWVGLSFRFVRREFSFNLGGETVTTNRMLPVEYLGGENTSENTGGIPDGLKDMVLSGIDETVLTALRGIAAECSTAQEFAGKVFANAAVVEMLTPETQARVLGEGFFDALK